MNKLRTVPRFTLDIFFLTLANALWSLGFNMYYSVLPVYIKNFCANDQIVGFVMSITYITGILTVLGGFLTSRINAKYIVVFAWLITIPAPFIFMFSENWQLFAVGQFLYALTALGGPGIALYVFDYPYAGDKMGAYMAINMGSMACAVFAPSIGGIISKAYGMRTVFLVSFILYIIATFFTLIIKKYKKPSDNASSVNASGGKGTNRKVILIIALMCIMHFGQYIAEPVLSLYLKESRGFDMSFIGYSFTSLGIGGVIAMYAAKRFDMKIGTVKLLFAISAMFIGANLMIGMSGMTAILAAMAIRGSSKAMLGFSQGKITEMLDGPNKGLILSIYMSVRSLTLAIASNIGAGLYSVGSYIPFIAETAILLLWLVLIIGFNRKFDFFGENQKSRKNCVNSTCN